jgi:hypothetical protein
MSRVNVTAGAFRSAIETCGDRLFLSIGRSQITAPAAPATAARINNRRRDILGFSVLTAPVSPGCCLIFAHDTLEGYFKLRVYGQGASCQCCLHESCEAAGSLIMAHPSGK